MPAAPPLPAALAPLAETGVTLGRAFGAVSLAEGGRIFALLQAGRLVVRLPPARVDALLAEGTGQRFQDGRGRPMRGWLAVPPEQEARWAGLAAEARG